MVRDSKYELESSDIWEVCSENWRYKVKKLMQEL